MMVNERWEIQNKLYHMKARMNELESFMKNTKKHYRFLYRYSLLKKRKYESYFEYLGSIITLFLFDLDKILGFYYNKYKAFKLLKKVEKEITTLTKDIKYYEHKL